MPGNVPVCKYEFNELEINEVHCTNKTAIKLK